MESEEEYNPTNLSEFNEIKPQTKVGFQTFDGAWYKGIALNSPSDGYVDVRCSLAHDVTHSLIHYVVKRINPRNVEHIFWLDHNPFKSEAQRRFMWKFHPEIAKRWAHGH